MSKKTSNEPKHSLLINFPTSTFNLLREQAKEKGCNMTEYVNFLIDGSIIVECKNCIKNKRYESIISFFRDLGCF